MSRKCFACFALYCVVVAQAAHAAPTMSVVPQGLNAGNREWLVSIDPDEALFSNNPPNGVGGSVAVELAFSIDDPTELLSVVVADPALWPADNPGNNPFPGGANCCGTILDLVGDRAFTAYGSTYFTTGTPKPFLKITTAGAGLTTLRYGVAAGGHPINGARIAQAGQNFDGYTGIVSIPEPTAIVLAFVAALGVAIPRRR